MASKLQIAAFSGLLFYVIANPITYSMMNAVFARFGLPVETSGKPTGLGLVVHSVVFALVTYLLMKL